MLAARTDLWLDQECAEIVTMSNNVRDNTERHRFELDAQGHIAFSNYKRADGVLTILHTEVPKELEGQGIGSALVRGVLDLARASGEKVIPACPFVKGYIDRHPEYADLRA
jgi:predicted GNAT family acetyltransferase